MTAHDRVGVIQLVQHHLAITPAGDDDVPAGRVCSAGITGITEASPHAAIDPVEDFNDYPKRVALAVATLLRSGIGGP